MAFTYSPNQFKAKHFEEIFSEILYSNNTVSRSNVVRVLDNVKSERPVTTMGGDINWSGYTSSPDITQYTDALSAADELISPKKIMALATFTYDDLRNTRFEESMSAGAKNVTSDEFTQAVLSYSIPRLGLSYEKKYWQGVASATKTAIASGSAPSNQKTVIAALAPDLTDGVLAQAVKKADTINVTGTTLTISNLKTEFNKVYTAIPAAVEQSGEAVIFAPWSVRKLIKQANQAEQYRDVFGVNGDSFDFLGIRIEFVPLPENVMIAGRWSDIVLGTDLLSDIGEIEIGKVTNYGDQMFIKAVATLGSVVLISKQKVIYA
ncbi:hypothetical protein [Xanthocytophaga agilis]|uniref:Uncharacterized protein n=1 Tax=Xanthocytophaga agilis TaxID=3048010 RepID=A0AAE3UEU8_9BACT|nr:hypothetical protein [Xanthocytophaga agilis]MDJ1500672.1 hypothetical protein [Xanthocytophaga agilis]